MIDDPKRQNQGDDDDQGSAGGQAYQDMGETGVTQDDLNQDITGDMDEE